MKRKQLWIGLVILVGVLLLGIASASAAGWTKEGDHLMYWEGDTADTSKKGQQTIDGKLYYFY